MERYKAALLPKYNARSDQEHGGYLASMGRMMDCTEKNAVYKVHITAGHAEKDQPEKIGSNSESWPGRLIRRALTPVNGLFAERYYYKYLKDAAMNYRAKP